jgi:hypothetical protein
MLKFTLLEIANMINKGNNRTLTTSEAAKMLNDLKGMDVSEANIYLAYWSTMQWFKRINTNNGINCLYVFQSCKDNKNAYINFLLSDVENTK